MPEPTASLPARHVFVYGTLRRGELRDITGLSPAPVWVGLGSVAGVLYDLGPYPGVLLGGPGRVSGEVYTIAAELEAQLDAIEEVWPQQTGEYRKQLVQVRLDGQGVQTLACLVYEISAARTVGKPVLRSGDWLDRDRSQP